MTAFPARLRLFVLFSASVGLASAAALPAGLPPGPLVWLAPETLAEATPGASVARWPDGSGHKRDAVQPRPQARPTVVAGPNGLPAVRIAGPRAVLELPELRLGHETSVFIVAHDVAQLPQESIHHGLLSAANDPYRKDADGYGLAYYNGAFTGFTVILSEGKNWEHLRDWKVKTPRECFEIISFVKPGAHADLYRNGHHVADREFARPADAAYTTGYQLGWSEGRTYTGAVAEVLAYDRALTEAERRQVEMYLADKYAIRLAAKPRPVIEDPRFFDRGALMFSNGYNDQPYVVQVSPDRWLAIVTTAEKEENDKDRHMVFLESRDQGASWARIETSLEPLAELRQPSWGTLLLTPAGRLYCFYNLEGAKRGERMSYVFRFSDDNARTWSERHVLPVRRTAIDADFRNTRSWGIDQPVVLGDGRVLIAFSKFGGPDRQGEGWFMASDNVLTERDPAAIRWQTLPEGERGIVSREVGFLQEEHNVEPLDGTGKKLYAVFRTLEGYVGESYSDDGGLTWRETGFAADARGNLIKNPRACAMLWRTADGRFLLWTHDHDGRSSAPQRNKDRNPAWLRAGVLDPVAGRIRWSEPEPVLFGLDFKHNSGMSYPNLVEYGGRYHLTATNKVDARFFTLPNELLDGLWATVTPGAARVAPPAAVGPRPTDVSLEQGSLSVVFEVSSEAAAAAPGEMLLALGDLRVLSAEQGALRIELRDDSACAPFVWTTDAAGGAAGRYALVFDGAANLLYVTKDGDLQDGGRERQFGWGRFTHELDHVRLGEAELAPGVGLERLEARRLATAEAVALSSGR
jgi:hypothetical protein